MEKRKKYSDRKKDLQTWSDAYKFVIGKNLKFSQETVTDLKGNKCKRIIQDVEWKILIFSSPFIWNGQ
jgi:hypothetical protein